MHVPVGILDGVLSMRPAPCGILLGTQAQGVWMGALQCTSTALLGGGCTASGLVQYNMMFPGLLSVLPWGWGWVSLLLMMAATGAGRSVGWGSTPRGTDWLGLFCLPKLHGNMTR
jgi:hypothetical protein